MRERPRGGARFILARFERAGVDYGDTVGAKQADVDGSSIPAALDVVRLEGGGKLNRPDRPRVEVDTYRDSAVGFVRDERPSESPGDGDVVCANSEREQRHHSLARMGVENGKVPLRPRSRTGSRLITQIVSSESGLDRTQ